MKRQIISSIAIFALGFAVGAGALHLLVCRPQTQTIVQLIDHFYSGNLIDRVLVAGRLRVGQEQETLRDSEILIEQGVVAVNRLAPSSGATHHALQVAKAYYQYHSVPVPSSAQTVLATVEPVSRQSFENLRDLSLSPVR